MTATPPTLLLVEDMGIARVCRSELTQAGWDVLVSTTVRDALYRAADTQVDALIVAIQLPDGRGDVVYYRLSSLYPPLRSRTLFLTTTEVEQRLIKPTRCLSLQVPVTPEAIRNALTPIRQRLM